MKAWACLCHGRGGCHRPACPWPGVLPCFFISLRWSGEMDGHGLVVSTANMRVTKLENEENACMMISPSASLPPPHPHNTQEDNKHVCRTSSLCALVGAAARHGGRYQARCPGKKQRQRGGEGGRWREAHLHPLSFVCAFGPHPRPFLPLYTQLGPDPGRAADDGWAWFRSSGYGLGGRGPQGAQGGLASGLRHHGFLHHPLPNLQALHGRCQGCARGWYVCVGWIWVVLGGWLSRCILFFWGGHGSLITMVSPTALLRLASSCSQGKMLYLFAASKDDVGVLQVFLFH